MYTNPRKNNVKNSPICHEDPRGRIFTNLVTESSRWCNQR